MELSKQDAFLVLRTAYKTGLLEKLMQKPPKPEVLVPGVGVIEDPADQPDLALFEEAGAFLAELLYEARKGGNGE